MEKTESARYLGDAAQGTKLLNSTRFTLDSREASLATIGVRGLD
jgi:hypothetical protein